MGQEAGAVTAVASRPVLVVTSVHIARLGDQLGNSNLVELADFGAEGDGNDAGVKKIPGADDPATPAN